MNKISLVIALALIFFFKTEVHCAGTVRAVTNGEYLDNCLSLISQAKNSINIATLCFDNDTTAGRIKEALYQAVNRGVKVRLIIDDSALKKDRDVIDELQQACIPVKIDGPRRTLHEKLLIGDRHLLLFGSTNLGAKSITENNETNIMVDDVSAGQAFAEYFEELWHDPDRQARFPAAISSNLITPLNSYDYARTLPKVLRKAKKRVLVIMYDARVYQGGNSPTAEILEAVLSEKVRGADVRVILEKSDHDADLNATNSETAALLASNNVPVRFDSPSTITHAKLVIADDTVILGSSNWNARSLKVNNEVNAMVAIPSVTSDFTAYFEKLWEQSSQN